MSYYVDIEIRKRGAIGAFETRRTEVQGESEERVREVVFQDFQNRGYETRGIWIEKA